MNFDLRNRRDDAAKNRAVAAMRLSPDETVAMLARDAAKYRKDMAEFRAKKFMRVPGDTLFNCGACSGRGGCVDAYGRLQPCMGMRAPALTVDLLDGQGAGAEEQRSRGAGEQGGKQSPLLPRPPAPLLKLSDALEQFPRLRELRATNPEYLRRCAKCFLKGLCEQCPAKSWAESGTLDTPVEYLCEVAHAQARYLGWLGENEYGWEKLLQEDRKNTEK
jgi:hypothetical protein